MSKSIATRKKTEVSAEARELMQKQLAEMNDRVSIGGGRSISTRGRRFTFPDGSKQSGPLDVIVLDFMSWNTYFDPDQPYDEENPLPPICYAFNEKPRQLKPSPNSKELQIEEGESCSTCPWDVFGSAPNGKAKACKNRRVMAVLPPDATDEDEIMTIAASSTAIRRFDDFVQECKNEHGVTPLGVVVELDFFEAVDYPSLTFTVVGANPDVNYYMNKLPEARTILTSEPTYSEDSEQETAVAAPKRTPRKKAVAKKKTTARKKRAARR